MTDPGPGIVVDLERILGHQSDGAGDAARAFLITLDGVVVASRLWSGHPRIMGRFTMLTGDPSHRWNRALDATWGRDRERFGRTDDTKRTYSVAVIETAPRSRRSPRRRD